MTKGLVSRNKSFCGFICPLSLGNYFRPIRFLIGSLAQGKNPVLLLSGKHFSSDIKLGWSPLGGLQPFLPLCV